MAHDQGNSPPSDYRDFGAIDHRTLTQMVNNLLEARAPLPEGVQLLDVFMTVDEDELGRRTMAEWSLVEHFEVEAYVDSVECYDRHQSSKQLEHPKVVRKRRFLLRKRRDDRLKELSLSVDKKTRRICDLEKALQSANKLSEEAELEAAEHQEQTESLRRMLLCERERADGVATAAGRLERDIAKIRYAIGATKVDEILGKEE